MIKIKTFNYYPISIDAEVNKWLGEHPDATLLFPPTTVLGNGGYIIITLVYSE